MFRSRLGRLFLAVSVAGLLVFGSYHAGQFQGRKAEKIKALRATIETMEDAKAVQDEINSLSDTDVFGALSKWLREDD